MKRAVPSMLMLQPMGRTKRVMRGSMRSFSFMQRNVSGRAAALQALPDQFSHEFRNDFKCVFD